MSYRPSKREETAPPPQPIAQDVIDCHAHIGKVKSWSKRIVGSVVSTADDLVMYMDASGIQKAVVLPVASYYLDIGEQIERTEAVMREVANLSRRLVPFCAVSPLDPEARRRIEEFAEAGCKGFGEHKVELPVDHPKSKELYGLCGELGLPVLIHIDQRFNPTIREFEEVVRRFETVKFIAHGPGWWSHMSAKVDPEVAYPKSKVRHPGNAPRILRTYPNAFADVSATSGLNALARDKTFARKFLMEHSNKILYGTDYPCLHPSGGQFGPGGFHLRLLKSLKLPQRVMDRILRENAEGLIK